MGSATDRARDSGTEPKTVAVTAATASSAVAVVPGDCAAGGTAAARGVTAPDSKVIATTLAATAIAAVSSAQ